MEKDDGSKKALIIAVSHYDLLQPLTFCMNDGNEMFTTLGSLGYEIQENHRLIGRVKWDDLRCAIIDFFRNRNVRPKDTLLLYYSGHGVLDAYGDHYLAPSELDPFQPDAKGFPFDELTKMIDKSNSQRVVTVLDCCYSGAARIGKGSEEDAANAGRKAIDEKSRILERGEGKCILAASQAYQKAFETAQKNHSLFSYYLIEGLKGNEETVDNYGYVTPDSLGRYVYNKIMSLPPEERPMQKPIRKVQQSGDIVLAYYPQFLKTKYGDVQLKEKSEASTYKDVLEENITTPPGNKLDKKSTGDFVNEVATIETYIKEHRNFNFSSCARDLGLSINEIRTIVSYIFENKFKCSNCDQRFKTGLDLKTHNETHH